MVVIDGKERCLQYVCVTCCVHDLVWGLGLGCGHFGPWIYRLLKRNIPSSLLLIGKKPLVAVLHCLPVLIGKSPLVPVPHCLPLLTDKNGPVVHCVQVAGKTKESYVYPHRKGVLGEMPSSGACLFPLRFV